VRGISDQGNSERHALDSLRTLEHIYAANSNNFVASFSFAQNLIAYFATGSKTAVNIISASGPSGSYTALQKWLKDHGKVPLECPKECDIVTIFDNNQVGSVVSVFLLG